MNHFWKNEKKKKKINWYKTSVTMFYVIPFHRLHAAYPCYQMRKILLFSVDFFSVLFTHVVALS